MRRAPSLDLSTAAPRAALALWLVVLGALTLSPHHSTHVDPSVPQLSLCVICGDRGTADAVLNVLLFVPLGVLLGVRNRAVPRIIVAGLLLSSAVETAQHFIPGRYSNLGDVVWNTTGAGLGALVWSLRTRWMPPRQEWGGRIADGAAVGAVLVTFAFGWLMRPAWPVERYWGQWTPDVGFMKPYRGSVVRARLDSIPIPPGPFPKRYDPRGLLLRDWTMNALVVKGRPRRSLSPILNLYDAEQREVTMLGAYGEDLVYRERSRARVLRLDRPDLRFPGALAATSVGDTMRLEVLRRGPGRCLRVDARQACPGFTPGRAWSLLVYPEEATERWRGGADALWMFLLLLPAGFWSERPRGLAARGAGVAAGIGLVVGLTRLVAPGWTQGVASLLGLLAGYVCRLGLRSFLLRRT